MSDVLVDAVQSFKHRILFNLLGAAALDFHWHLLKWPKTGLSFALLLDKEKPAFAGLLVTS